VYRTRGMWLCCWEGILPLESLPELFLLCRVLVVHGILPHNIFSVCLCQQSKAPDESDIRLGRKLRQESL
jgi:hypothetical protein